MRCGVATTNSYCHRILKVTHGHKTARGNGMIVDKLGVSRTMVVLITIALLYPVVLCAVFFPTPFADLREQIHWGLNFPLARGEREFTPAG